MFAYHSQAKDKLNELAGFNGVTEICKCWILPVYQQNANNDFNAENKIKILLASLLISSGHFL